MELVARRLVAATWLGIAVNVLLTGAKGIVGFLANSQALLADAAHSASDVVGSVVALFGVKMADAPPDDDHPYGHGKAEHVASIIVALLLIAVGVQMAGSAVKVLMTGGPSAPGSLALPVITLSIIVKELLFRYKLRLGQRYGSAALVAEAWHHRSDSFSSIAALFGVGAARLGEVLGLPYLLYGDAAAGLVVSLIIIKVGVALAKDSSSVMMEQVLDEEEIASFAETAASVPGVMGIDQLHARSHGRYVIIDIKIGVHRHLTVEAGHRIGKQVKHKLLARHAEVEDVFVHVNPHG